MTDATIIEAELVGALAAAIGAVVEHLHRCPAVGERLLAVVAGQLGEQERVLIRSLHYDLRVASGETADRPRLPSRVSRPPRPTLTSPSNEVKPSRWG